MPRPLLGAFRRFALPRFPASRRLALRYAVSDSLGEHEMELVHLHRIVEPGGVAIDAGANLGFYSYRLASLCERVIAIEPNTAISSELRDFDPGNIAIVSKAVSNRAGRAKLYVPQQNGRALAGWASLDSGHLPGAERLVEIEVELCSIDSLGAAPVSFIKIDVEGHEVEVLEGAEATIRRGRPRLLVEVRPANESRVTSMLRDWGYERVTLAELAGVTGCPDNYLFRPRGARRS